MERLDAVFAAFRKSPSLYFLILFLFFLPTAEAPKNIFLFLFFVTAAFEINWKRFRFDNYDLVILILFAAHVISTYFSEIKGGEWRALLDLARFCLFFIMVRRLDYVISRFSSILFWFLVAVSIAAGISIFEFFQNPNDKGLSLMSVGGENISGVFLSISFLMCLAFIVQRLHQRKGVLVFLLSLMFISLALLATGSVAAVGMTIASAVIFVFVYSFFSGEKISIIFWVIGLSLVSGALSFKTGVYDLKMEEVKQSRLLEARHNIWSGHYILHSINPVFGLGKDNHKEFDIDKIICYAEKHNLTEYIPDKKYHYFFTGQSTHAHNLFLQELIDYGLFGLFSIVLTFFVMITASLGKIVKEKGVSAESTVAISLLAACLIVIGCGITTPSFHHEVLMLVGLLFALTTVKPSLKEDMIES